MSNVATAIPTEHSAAHYRRDGSFEVRREPVPEPFPGEALIAVEAAGICGTDLHITRIPSTYVWDTEILGHEFCGRVVEGPPHLAGQRVVVDPALMCGACGPCVRGLPTQCENFQGIGITAPGGFAEYVVVPVDRLLPVSDHLDGATAALTEPLACVLYALRRVPALEPAGRAVVLGGGPIGALFAVVLERAMSQRVVVSEPNDVRRRRLGARLAGDVVEPDAVGPELAPELVVDTTGFLFGNAVDVVRPGGALLLFGLEERGGSSAQVRFTQKELTAVSSFAAWGTFGKAIELLESGLIVGEDLITATYRLEEIAEAFDVARAGHGLKVAVRPS